MILQIVNPFDTNQKFNPLYTINTNEGGVLKLQLKYAINQPNELIAEFTPNLPSVAYNAIKDADYGLRIQKDGHDMLFVQDQASKTIDNNGIVSVRFYSSIYKLIYSRPRIVNSQFINTSAIEIANKIDDIEFILISDDKKISYIVGANDNLTILNDLRKATGTWSYFDLGLYKKGDNQYITRVLLGDYQNIEHYGQIDERFATETVDTKNTNKTTLSSPTLLDIKTYYNGRNIKFLKAVLDTGLGTGASNASITFTSTQYSFIDPIYPLVNIDGTIYIHDTTYSGLEDRYLIYPVTMTSTTYDQNVNNIYDNEQALKYLYQKSIYYLKTQQNTKRFDCTLAFKRLTFPKYFVINYTYKVKNNLNENITITEINDKLLFKEINYDLTKL